MKPEHAIRMLAGRGHKLTTDEPLLILLKLVDREELIRHLPQDRNRVKRLLMEHGYQPCPGMVVSEQSAWSRPSKCRDSPAGARHRDQDAALSPRSRTAPARAPLGFP